MLVHFIFMSPRVPARLGRSIGLSGRGRIPRFSRKCPTAWLKCLPLVHNPVWHDYLPATVGAWRCHLRPTTPGVILFMQASQTWRPGCHHRHLATPGCHHRVLHIFRVSATASGASRKRGCVSTVPLLYVEPGRVCSPVQNPRRTRVRLRLKLFV